MSFYTGEDLKRAVLNLQWCMFTRITNKGVIPNQIFKIKRDGFKGKTHKKAPDGLPICIPHQKGWGLREDNPNGLLICLPNQKEGVEGET